MERQPLLQRSFSAGQIDGAATGRSDAGVYDAGLGWLRNMLPWASGALRLRPGSYITATLAGPRRLYGFVFNRSQRYVCAFAAGTVDFYDGTSGALVASLSGAPWTTANIYEMRIVVRGDTMVIAHEDFYPQVVKRTGATTFTLTPFAFETHSSGWPRYEPMYKFADPSVTISTSGTTGTVTVTASASVFTSDHVGSLLSKDGKQMEITGYTSGTQVTAVVRETLTGSGASTDWKESVVATARGYPRSVAFHGQRLVFGGTRDLPLHVMTSKAAAFFNFDVGTGNDDESVFIPIGGEVSTIQDVISLSTLVVLTDRGPFFLPESDTSPLTPSSANPKQVNAEPAGYDAQAVRYKDSILYVSLSGAVITELRYNPLDQGYEWATASLLFRDFPNDIRQSALVNQSFNGVESFAIFLNGDGTMQFWHKIQQENQQGWFPATTNGTIHSVAGVDENVWLAVERTIDGSPAWFLERMDETYTLDGAVRVTVGTATDSFSGFTALANTLVDVVASGVTATGATQTNSYYLGTYTVSAGGVIDISDRGYTCTQLTAGFKFPEAGIDPLPAVVRNAAGEWIGTPKKVTRVVAKVRSTLSLDIGSDSLNLLSVDDDFSVATSPLTSEHRVWRLGWGTTGVVSLRINTPLPCEILAIMREVVF